MATRSVGVVKESDPAEHRVAVVPEVVPKLRELGLDVRVQADAGARAWFADSAYTEAGASVHGPDETADADLLVCVAPPDPSWIAARRPGQILVGLLNPFGRPDLVEACRSAGLTAL